MNELKCRKEFDAWHYEKFCNSCAMGDETNQAVYDAIYSTDDNKGEREREFEVWAYQQARINQLEENLRTGNRLLHSRDQTIDVFIKSKETMKADMSTLQVRIDKALEIAEDLMQSMEFYKVGERLEKILKGGGA